MRTLHNPQVREALLNHGTLPAAQQFCDCDVCAAGSCLLSRIVMVYSWHLSRLRGHHAHRRTL